MAAVLVNGCRKTAKLVEPSVTTNNNNSIEEKFFNNHASTEPLVKALNGFLRRINDSLHFVHTTVIRIGYPKWDKAISKSKNNNVNSRGASGNSVTLTNIPFVRDSQNYVNSTMIIQSNPTVTNFSYLSDWQYKQQQYGLINADSSAEHIAAYFMLFDKVVFGYTHFKLTDNNLFVDSPISPDDENREVYMINATSNERRLSSYTITQCWGFIVCGSPSICDLRGGCEGGGTPQECDPGPTEGNKTSSNLPACGPGWEPAPIEDEDSYDPDFDPNSYPESSEILQFENDYRSKMSQQEIVIFDDMSRLNQLKYLYNAKYAIEKAEELYPASLHNGNGDAFRHALFSGLNTKVLGYTLAKQLGDAHETFPNGNPLENEMDLFNNQVGRNLYSSLLQDGYGGALFKPTLVVLLSSHLVPTGQLRKIYPLGPDIEILQNSILIPTD